MQWSRATITSMAHIMGLSRPKELPYRKREPICESLNIKAFHDATLPSSSIEQLDIQSLLLQLAEFLKATAIVSDRKQKR